MPPLAPLPSLARVEANRRNAQLSTGPKSELGKSRSRGNALKHGLSGVGIALPTEDEAVVLERFTAIQAELNPRTAFGAYLVGQIALATVRTQRAARQEAAALATRVRHAAEEFDIARERQAADAMVRLATPAENIAARRELLRMPEGVDLMIHALLQLRDDVITASPVWDAARDAYLEAICGRMPGETHIWDGRSYSRAVLGDSSLLTPADHAEAKKYPNLRSWCAGLLVIVIDEEVDRLQRHRATLDHEALALDRAEAADRALFDSGRDATLARRYEASATRDLYRALAQLQIVEAEVQPEPALIESAPPTPATMPEPLPFATEPSGGLIKENFSVAAKSIPDKQFNAVLASFGNSVLPVASACGSPPSEGTIHQPAA